ncbi:methionine synthase [Actinopolyspora erythraea]|uniref:Methionine synthase n=1 Tax=Actinopolyspora erythraea TaxID=414996 RepID=A0A099D3B6_9ACTN|nr:methionine synthase [Actinopolyspora erythraea]KGI79840.1 methionine synthase [Actinopolyspora erythraea]
MVLVTQQQPWKPGTATAVGSMPGTDPLETARIVAGELPGLTPMPELPARGVGGDMLGRTAGMLPDLAVEVVPSGYRVARTAGRDQRRAVDLLRWDLDALEEVTAADTTPRLVKLQAAGPWSLAAGIELRSGHRVLTDHGALRDFTEALTEGIARHAAQVAARTGGRTLVQLDEPTLPAVLSGDLPTPSGYGTVPAVAEPEVRQLLQHTIDRLGEAVARPVIVHCCAARPPVRLLRRAGAGALSLDARALESASGEFAEEVGEACDAGLPLLVGMVPAAEPGREPGPRELVEPVRAFVTKLGFSERVLAEQVVATPTCGLAGASPRWARRALDLTRELGEMLPERFPED